MVIESFDLPGQNCGEITLIGTAGGYGESIVVHLGDNNWIVVDSCKDPNTGISLPLHYLTTIGVNVKSDVKMIICTHWHNDHIGGLSQLLEACLSSKFSFAPCTDLEKFRLFVGLDQRKDSSNRSSTEFYDCLKLSTERGNEIIRAFQDRILLKLKPSGSSVISLSPSDATLTAYDHEISTLIDEIRPERRVVIKSPNSKSVALLLCLGEHKAILGADLEVSVNDNEGWVNILDSSQVIDKEKPASFFKVSHHGSSNGHIDRIWNELLVKNPVAKLTTYNSSNLPRKVMLDVFLKTTKNLYATAKAEVGKAKKRERSIEKAIKDYKPNLIEAKYSKGIIRSRILLDDPNAVWETKIHGSAYLIT